MVVSSGIGLENFTNGGADSGDHFLFISKQVGRTVKVDSQMWMKVEEEEQRPYPFSQQL